MSLQVSMRDWRMTFLPAFKACVDQGSLSLMCSYNRYTHITHKTVNFLWAWTWRMISWSVYNRCSCSTETCIVRNIAFRCVLYITSANCELWLKLFKPYFCHHFKVTRYCEYAGTILPRMFRLENSMTCAGDEVELCIIRVPSQYKKKLLPV